MNQNYHEEKKIDKSFDIQLFKRLFQFSRPYLPIFILCIVMLFAITAVDLVRPYLIKVVIDDHINAWSHPMAVLSEPLPGSEWATYKGQYYIRLTTLNEEEKSDLGEDTPLTQLFVSKEGRYLIDGVLPPGYEPSISELSAGVFQAEGTAYQAYRLTNQEYEEFRSQDKTGVTRVILIFSAILFSGFILNYLQALLLNYASSKQIFEMRQALFSHLMNQSLSFFDKNPVGRLVTRATNDMNNINEMYTSVLINAIKDIMLLVGTIFVMFALNAKLALISLLTFPLIGLAAYKFRMKAREAHRSVKVKIARINATLAENIAGMKIIQIFDQQASVRSGFKEINDDHLHASLEEIRVFAIFRPTMNLIYSLTLAILIWYGGSSAIRGALELGVLFAFINYTEQFYRPIFDLSEKFNILQSAMASAERIFLLFDTDERIPEGIEGIELEPFRGEIEFRNVWFSYEPGNWVLKDVSFKVSPGETVAFVGATGSGKTTIISLLNRFYDIQKGQILVDGHDIRDINRSALRSKIGMVLQDVFLFAGDIKGNIRLNQTDMPMECLESVARHVNADPFIKKLPGGYDEPVQERGSTLSSGQRQLLSFARALAFSPEILILDEATSNIDTETEQLIQEAIDRIVKDRTTIVIAHRLSTIQNADKIIVLHKGTIREVGSHEALLAEGGIYHSLYQLQYK